METDILKLPEYADWESWYLDPFPLCGSDNLKDMHYCSDEMETKVMCCDCKCTAPVSAWQIRVIKMFEERDKLLGK